MAVMNGQSFPHVTVTRSAENYPCFTVMILDLENDPGLDGRSGKADKVTIAGLWADSTTAVLSMIYTNYHAATSVLDLVGIETIPVIREGNSIRAVLASQDIRFSPDQESILSFNLSTMQFDSEILRLDMPRPTDVYVAVTQNAYFIDIDNQGTVNDPADDGYSVTGGGQLIEVDGNSAEIIQQAMVEVEVTSACRVNPSDGMALVRVTGLESAGFPELGTAVLEFNDHCDGQARIYVATGMYAGANGQSISFLL